MRKIYLPALLLVLLVGSPASAEKYHFNGGGGFHLGMHSPDLDFLDKQLQRYTPGFKKVEGPLIYFGGFGFGEVADNIRIGGYGFGGGTSISGTVVKPGDNSRHRQDVTIGLGGGGFLVEYVPFHFARRCEVDLDLGIGFGSVEIAIDQFGSSVIWDDLMGSLHPDSAATRQTFSISMAQSFFMLEPAVAMKFYINSFMAVEGRAGYLLALGIDDWQFRDVKILDMPDVDLSAPVYGIRITFGG